MKYTFIDSSSANNKIKEVRQFVKEVKPNIGPLSEDFLILAYLGLYLKHGPKYEGIVKKAISTTDYLFYNELSPEELARFIKICNDINYPCCGSFTNVDYAKNKGKIVTKREILIGNSDFNKRSQIIGKTIHEMSHCCFYGDKQDDSDPSIIYSNLRINKIDETGKFISSKREEYDELINSLITYDALLCLASMSKLSIEDQRINDYIVTIKECEDKNLLEFLAGHHDRTELVKDLYNNKTYQELLSKEIMEGNYGIIEKTINDESYNEFLEEIENSFAEDFNNTSKIQKNSKKVLHILEGEPYGLQRIRKYFL